MECPSRGLCGKGATHSVAKARHTVCRMAYNRFTLTLSMVHHSLHCRALCWVITSPAMDSVSQETIFPLSHFLRCKLLVKVYVIFSFSPYNLNLRIRDALMQQSRLLNQTLTSGYFSSSKVFKYNYCSDNEIKGSYHSRGSFVYNYMLPSGLFCM